MSKHQEKTVVSESQPEPVTHRIGEFFQALFDEARKEVLDMLAASQVLGPDQLKAARIAVENAALVDEFIRAANLTGPEQYSVLCAAAQHAKALRMTEDLQPVIVPPEVMTKEAGKPSKPKSQRAPDKERKRSARHAYYLKLKAAGMCVRCKKRPTELGLTQCVSCRANDNLRSKERRARLST